MIVEIHSAQGDMSTLIQKLPDHTVAQIAAVDIGWQHKHRAIQIANSEGRLIEERIILSHQQLYFLGTQLEALHAQGKFCSLLFRHVAFVASNHNIVRTIKEGVAGAKGAL